MPTIHRARALPAALLLASALFGCGSESGTGGSGGQTTTGPRCASDPRVTSYAVGIAATSTDGKTKVTFADALPAPPEKGSNVWTIDVADDQGKPVEGATIKLELFMPEHGHAATITPTVKAGDKAGRYVVSDIELFMPGIWENTFTITPAGGIATTVVFTFCVDG